jgi:ribosomal protein L16 Arg81 hydroxylase
MQLEQCIPLRKDVPRVSGDEFARYADAFNQSNGSDKDFLFPLLFAGCGKNWDISTYDIVRFQLEFGELEVPIFHEWNSGFQQKNTVKQQTMSEHIKDIFVDPTKSGYLLGAINDNGESQPDPAGEEISAEEFFEARKNRSKIISSLVRTTNLQIIANGTTAIFFGGHSITRLHRHQPSFLLQVLGKKRTSLIGPRFSEFVYRQNVSQYAENLIDFHDINIEKYPQLKHVNIFDVVTEPGDILFIPNRWFHYVEAVEFPSVSLTRFAKIAKV